MISRGLELETKLVVGALFTHERQVTFMAGQRGIFFQCLLLPQLRHVVFLAEQYAFVWEGVQLSYLSVFGVGDLGGLCVIFFSVYY